MNKKTILSVLLVAAVALSVAFAGAGMTAAQEAPDENGTDENGTDSPNDADPSDNASENESEDESDRDRSDQAPDEDENASENVPDDVPVGNADAPPNDLDGDNRTEDVNGDNETTAVDTQFFFANLPDAAVENSPRFDFNDDGSVDVVDIQKHFQTEV
jgi:cytoskeletal protein RodZ